MRHRMFLFVTWQGGRRIAGAGSDWDPRPKAGKALPVNRVAVWDALLDAPQLADGIIDTGK